MEKGPRVRRAPNLPRMVEVRSGRAGDEGAMALTSRMALARRLTGLRLDDPFRVIHDVARRMTFFVAILPRMPIDPLTVELAVVGLAVGGLEETLHGFPSLVERRFDRSTFLTSLH
jgi:hypothetical protein